MWPPTFVAQPVPMGALKLDADIEAHNVIAQLSCGEHPGLLVRFTRRKEPSMPSISFFPGLQGRGLHCSAHLWRAASATGAPKPTRATSSARPSGVSLALGCGDMGGPLCRKRRQLTACGRPRNLPPSMRKQPVGTEQLDRSFVYRSAVVLRLLSSS